MFSINKNELGYYLRNRAVLNGTQDTFKRYIKLTSANGKDCKSQFHCPMSPSVMAWVLIEHV